MSARTRRAPRWYDVSETTGYVVAVAGVALIVVSAAALWGTVLNG
jgi:hypothetical protein